MNKRISILTHHVFRLNRKTSRALILSLGLAFLFSIPMAICQVAFFSEADFKGKDYRHADEAPDNIPSTIFDESVHSLIVGSGYKATLYSEENFGGDALVYFAGKYNETPPFYHHPPVDNPFKLDFEKKMKVRSYKVERVKDHSLVTLWYARKEVNGRIKYNSLKQHVGFGNFDKYELIGTTEVLGHTLYPYYWINTITIPHGVLVTIKNEKGESVILENHSSGTLEYFNTDNYPAIRNNNIASIEIKPASYKIKQVSLEYIDKKEFPDQQVFDTTYINPSISDPSTFGNERVFTRTGSIMNDFQHTVFHDLTIDASASANAGLTVNGEPTDAGSSTMFGNNFKHAALSSIEKSISYGHSASEQINYVIESHCKASCPPQAQCSTKAFAKPVITTYEATINFVMVDGDGREVPGSEFVVKSNVRVNKFLEGRCETSVENIAFDSTGFTEDYLTLITYYDYEKEDNVTVTSLEKDYGRAKDYQYQEPEGYILSHAAGMSMDESRVRPLKLYYSKDREDYITISTPKAEGDALAAGYQLVEVLGYVFKEQEPGTKPLKLFWSQGRTDNQVSALEQGEQAAKDFHYQFIRVEGYIFEQKPTADKTVTDVRVATIGQLNWMTENLNTLYCSDGSPIDTANLKQQGDQILYNVVALEACNICPSGWRLPTKNDFKTLKNAGKSSVELIDMLNINSASFGGDYIHIQDARLYHGDFKRVAEGRVSYTVKGNADRYHPVRCVQDSSN